MQRFWKKKFKGDKKEMGEIERGMVRFSLLTVLGPLNKGHEETWIPRDDQPVSWGRTGHCNVRSKAKSKGQNYPNLHKNVRRTCSHQKTTDFVILITTSSYNNISLICDFIQIDKTKQKQKKTWIKKDVCVLPTIKNNDSVCFASGERGVTVLFLYILCWQGSKDLTSSLRIRNKKKIAKTGSASIIRIEVTPFGERFHVPGQYRPRQ